MLDALLARCLPADWLPGLAAAAGPLGLPATLLVAGIVGGALHCAGMCGPFVLAQVTGGPVLERSRPGDLLLIPYHLGRTTTYTLLGALAGGTSGAFASAAGLKEIAALLLALGGGFFALLGATALGWLKGGGSGAWSAPWGRIVGRWAAPFLNAPTGLSGYGLGLVLGLLPCGLLWGALAVAAGTGRASAGALAMASFALGTVPALGAVAWVGSLAGSRFREWAARLAPPLLLVNAAFLFYFAWRAAA